LFEVTKQLLAVVDTRGLEQVERDLHVGAARERHEALGRVAGHPLERLEEGVAAEAGGIHQRPVDVPQHEPSHGAVACRFVADRVIVVHGGCGNPAAGVVRDEAAYHRAIEEALAFGSDVLEGGGSAVDSVQAAVESLEDCPLLNAGRGSVLTTSGTVEMDASIMSGGDLRAGAVAAVTGVRHAVALARAVMEETPHVLMAGLGAEQLASELELEFCAPEWFVTDRQRERWMASKGTVGAVALDAAGHLAAATSTGGVRGQLPGRVGDSPLLGAGCYAEDATCAVSATGDGELIIRAGLAAEIAALMRIGGLSLADACGRALGERVAPLRGDAGVIALDASGNVAMPANTRVMHRGVRRNGGSAETAVFV
jgi:L-asparaginase / beta-aspartyl-peptidase